jgi:hypothetical protein
VHFVIYIPGKANQETLANVGLPGLCADVFYKTIDPGPDKKQGTLFGWRTNTGRTYHEYRAWEQTWVASEPSDDQPEGAYWVGWKTDAPPLPEDLQRQFPYRSLKVLLGDGREWWIPAERELPFDLRFTAGRRWELVPMQHFDEFCHCCREMRELLSLAPDSRRDIFITELTEFARMGLSVNYRLCPEWESSAKLWNSEIWNGNKAQPLILDMIRKAAPHE